MRMYFARNKFITNHDYGDLFAHLLVQQQQNKLWYIPEEAKCGNSWSCHVPHLYLIDSTGEADHEANTLAQHN